MNNKVIKTVLKVISFFIIFAWVAIVAFDYISVRNEKSPKFCIYETTHKYKDGTTYECVGLGYKVFKYKRLSITATEFGTIFNKERQSIDGLVK